MLSLISRHYIVMMYELYDKFKFHLPSMNGNSGNSTKYNNSQHTQSNIKLYIRIRPLLDLEKTTANIIDIQPDERTLAVAINQYKCFSTKVDKVFPAFASQQQIFDSFEPILESLFNLHNVTIFTYGQTGSGKTHTMYGRNFDLLIQKLKGEPLPHKDFGILPRALSYIFECYKDKYPHGFSISCSFLQIYNQKIYDLLDESAHPQPLSLHESQSSGVYVKGLGEFEIQHYKDCFELVKRGVRNKKIRETVINSRSSRSHTIFKLIVQSTKLPEDIALRRAVLDLCDLAGSQKVNKNEHISNEHLKEIKNINLSLTALGSVINSLEKGKRASFRQSKLTRILQQSLTNNQHTFLIGTISPSSHNIDQTISTLKFVERIKKISIGSTSILQSNESKQIIHNLSQEISQLKAKIREKEVEKELYPQKIERQIKLLEAQNSELKSIEFNEDQYQSMLKQNKQMKYQLYYMEKLARYELYGVDDKTESVNSSQLSSQEADQLRDQIEKKKKKPLKQIGLPALIEQSQRRIRQRSLVRYRGKDNRSIEQIEKQKNNILRRYQEKTKNHDFSANHSRNSYESPERESRVHKTIELPELPKLPIQTIGSGKNIRRDTHYEQKIRLLESRLRR